MRLKNFLLVVEEIQRSKAFYKELFDLDVITDFDTNVILTGGLVLQQRDGWEPLIGRKTSFGGHAAELYFETTDMDGFLRKLEATEQEIRWLNPPQNSTPEHHAEADVYCQEKQREAETRVHRSSRQVVRLYDPDGHIIEVAGC